MRIRVHIPAQTVEVDVDKWSLEYGTDTTAEAVRKDVKAYFDLVSNIPDHLTDMVRVL